MRLVQKLWISIAMLCLSFTASAYDFEIDGLCYDVVDLVELTCGVSGTTESIDFSKEVVIPSHVSFLGKTLTVVSIMDNAFEKTDIVSISLPNTCTSIGKYAFYHCDKLKSINIPKGVTSIKSYAFSYCTSLTHINIPEGVTSIGNDAFAYCSSLTQVNIPDGVTSIDSSLFKNCSSLTEIKIPEGVTTIDYYAFQQSTITSLYISDSNQKLEFGSNAFDNSKIKNLYIGRELELELNPYNNCALFYNADIDSLTIGSRVTKIGMEFFIGKSVASKYSVKRVQKLNILPSEEILECDDNSLLLVDLNVLILGRQLLGSSSMMYTSHLKHLEIGENVNDIRNLPLDRNDITTMLVKRVLPPKCANGTFSKNTYLYCPLKVPVGSFSVYKFAEGWKNFWNIGECDFSGIETVEGDGNLSCVADNGDIRIDNKDENSIVRVYNIQGSMLAETSESVVNNLPKGLYIVTVENKSFKVSLR